MLSNYEVFLLLTITETHELVQFIQVYDFLVKCDEKKQSKKNNKSQNLATISYEVCMYISYNNNNQLFMINYYCCRQKSTYHKRLVLHRLINEVN